MKLLANESSARVIRIVITVLAIGAGMWHMLHAASAYGQWREYQASDPSLADYFRSAMMLEIMTGVVAMFAGIVAWRIIGPRMRPQSQG